MRPVTLPESITHDEGFQMLTPDWLQRGFYNGRTTFSAGQRVERHPFAARSRSVSCVPSAGAGSAKAPS